MVWVSSWSTRSLTQVLACTPFVTWPMGTSTGRERRPHPAEHLAGDVAVELGDPVRAGCEAQAHHRHVELAVRLVLSLTEFEQLVERDTALLGERVEVRLEQLARKPVDAGRHGGVGGEQPAGPDGFDGLGERQALLGPFADPFEPEEPGMTLVRVEHLRREPERPQRPDAADAEHDLLAQPVLLVAAVQAVGDRDRLPADSRARSCRAGTAGCSRRRRATP